jgi:hypothetical protein
MTTKKTVIALAATVGLGLLPLAVIGLAGCGDNPTDVNPFDAGVDAPKDTGPDAPADAAKDGGTDTGTDSGTDSGPKDSGPADAPTDGG